MAVSDLRKGGAKRLSMDAHMNKDPTKSIGGRVDYSEAATMESLRDEARAQALAEFKEIERKAMLAQMLEEERAKLMPAPKPEPEDIVSITIDVPPNVFINQANETGLTINGKSYVHDVTYQVPRALANDINHLMYRANHNEKSMGSPNREMHGRTFDRRRPFIRDGQLIPDPSLP
jgi:hypothetical protein